MICIVLAFPQIQITGFLPTDEKKCQYLRPDRMLKARCYHMDLREVPQFLKTGVEILDLSFNRIKKLNVTSFQRYASIRYLLLYDNMIQFIQPGTFSHLTALEEIDLANNALLTIPSELFQLPSLRNLYVDSNDLYDLDETLETLEKPIRAPLEYLNVANCGLQKIPRLGILPYILHLNASMNPLQAAVAQDFVPMCHIKSLDLRKTTMDPCNCLAIVEYLESLKVIVTDRIDCDIVDRKACDPVAFAIDTKDYDDCKSVTLNKESQNSWIIIFACIGASLVLLICGLCWYQKRRSNARRAQRRVNQEGPNRELLRNAN